MISVKKNIEDQTMTITINDISITISIGEWSRMIAREVPVFGLVSKV